VKSGTSPAALPGGKSFSSGCPVAPAPAVGARQDFHGLRSPAAWQEVRSTVRRADALFTAPVDADSNE
jgi:hypothetical protein